MHVLESHAYADVRPLVGGLRHCLVIDSIIEGHTPAWVYVDNPQEPNTALI